jgi:hypothetical protein
LDNLVAPQRRPAAGEPSIAQWRRWREARGAVENLDRASGRVGILHGARKRCPARLRGKGRVGRGKRKLMCRVEELLLPTLRENPLLMRCHLFIRTCESCPQRAAAAVARRRKSARHDMKNFVFYGHKVV